MLTKQHPAAASMPQSHNRLPRPTPDVIPRPKATATDRPVTRSNVSASMPSDTVLRRRLLKVIAGIALSGCGMLVGTTTFAQQLDTRILYANSMCSAPIRLLVFHKDSHADYHAHAWYHLRPYGESTLLSGDVTLRQITGYDLYIYAESTDGSGKVWEGNETTVNWNGVFYGLRKAPLTARNGRLEFQLTCP